MGRVVQSEPGKIFSTARGFSLKYWESGILSTDTSNSQYHSILIEKYILWLPACSSMCEHAKWWKYHEASHILPLILEYSSVNIFLVWALKIHESCLFSASHRSAFILALIAFDETCADSESQDGVPPTRCKDSECNSDIFIKYVYKYICQIYFPDFLV